MGREPVKRWMKQLSRKDRHKLAEDIRHIEFTWPVGMPRCRAMGKGLYEVRTGLSLGRIARTFFYVDRQRRMVLLHAFIKKTRKTPVKDIALAETYRKHHERGLQ